MLVTPEQFVAVLGAVTALVAALTGLYLQMRKTHALVNSRMGELLELTRRSAMAEGKLEGPSA